MARVALGQSKMVTKPIPGILHIFVYVGFVIINIEVTEIIVDGLFGTHRVLSFMGSFYSFLIASFEILALLVWGACVIFLIRRNVLRVKRFFYREMTTWPKTDANLILIFEIALMSAFLMMNAADFGLQGMNFEHNGHGYKIDGLTASAFPVSSVIYGFMENLSLSTLFSVERFSWWFHIIGILAFLNYITISKHFHIILAFPNTYFSKLFPKGQFDNMESVTKEVKLMMDPSADPYATLAPTEESSSEVPSKFGAKDVADLTWKNLMDAYTCTECGRCSEACPATQTGKLLSPRKIMMDTRDRLEEVGRNIDQNKGEFKDDGKSLLGDYILSEELWACTTCNACVQECPVNIDPVSIIMDLRRYLVMEESQSPTELNTMFTNTENNGAPWQFSPQDRLNWRDED